jgi:tRNA (cmo5U34)-methyltransferase
MGQFHFHPDAYLELMVSEMPGYFRLQDVAAAATGSGATRLLELGTGTGETARRVLERHPGAALIGIDAGEEMLAVARAALADADLRVARLQDPLPRGPFDVAFSVLAVHHLDGPGKASCSAASPPSSRPAVASCSATSWCPPIRPTRSRRSAPTSTCRAARMSRSSGCGPRAWTRAWHGPSATWP